MQGKTRGFDGRNPGAGNTRGDPGAGPTGRGLGNHDSTQQWQLGVQYAGIGPGINLWGGVVKFDQHNGDNSGICNNLAGFCSADANDGYSIVLGTTVTY